MALTIEIRVPAHGKLKGKPHPIAAPDWVSPGTEALAMTLVNPKTKKAVGKRFYWLLKPKTKGCRGGSLGAAGKKMTPLSCTFTESVAAGDYDAKLLGYADTAKRAPVIEAATVRLRLEKPKNTLKVALGGQPRYLSVQLSDPYAPAGVPATIGLRVLAADAWGFVIVGTYDVPLSLTDSDTTGATKLSIARVTNSTEANSASLGYTGAALSNGAILTVSAKTAQKAAAWFDPGAGGLEAYPDALFIAEPADVIIEPYGQGVLPPYSASLAADAFGNPSCAGIVTVGGASPLFVVTPVQLGACAIVFSDRAGHTLSVPVLVQSEVGSPGNPTPGPSPTPTPGPSPTPTPGSTSTPTPSSNVVRGDPSTVTLCPSSGSNACAQDTASVAISQAGFSGTFSESDTCGTALAAVTPVAASGPSASYTVTGGSTLGECAATFTGAGAQETTVTIDVTQSGWTINTRHRNATPPNPY